MSMKVAIFKLWDDTPDVSWGCLIWVTNLKTFQLHFAVAEKYLAHMQAEDSTHMFESGDQIHISILQY